MKVGDKTFYDGYWKDQLQLTCDEKCRLRFILSEVDRVARREAKAAINLGSRLGTAGHAPKLRIADVGCGRGWLTEALSHFGEAVGFDQSTVEAARRYPNLRFVECDVLELERAVNSGGRTRGAPDYRATSGATHDGPGMTNPYDSRRPVAGETGRTGGFDVAVCSEVIEHIRPEDQPRLIASISKILRQEGTLILTTPNRPVVFDLVQKLSLQSELQPIEEWLDATGLQKLLAPRFEVLELTSVMFFPMIARSIGPLSKLYRLLYERFGGYHLLDPLMHASLKGMYLALVARKRASCLETGVGAANCTCCSQRGQGERW